MTKSKISEDNLIESLIKLATGYYYDEEQFEYQKTQNKVNISKNHDNFNQNISFFDNCDMGITNSENLYDNIEASNGNKKNTIKNNENLTLIKKKITTHYVSPDINAIKILFEIIKKKVDSNDIKSLSDLELLKLKNKLVKELSNENFKDNKTT